MPYLIVFLIVFIILLTMAIAGFSAAPWLPTFGKDLKSAVGLAGIKEGDILVRMDGQAIKEDQKGGLAEMISKKRVGDRSELEVYRDGQTLKLTVVFEASE